MTKNLQTADEVVKLILSIGVIIFYFTNLISGPFAKALMYVATIIVIIFVVKLIIAKFLID